MRPIPHSETREDLGAQGERRGRELDRLVIDRESRRFSVHYAAERKVWKVSDIATPFYRQCEASWSMPAGPLSPGGIIHRRRVATPMAKQYHINVNGHERTVQADPDTPLLYVLRDRLRLRGPKFGCGLAQCGACTVMLDEKAVRSCVYPVSAVGTQRVTTVEGLPKRFEEAFAAEQAAQCGYCIPGMMVGAAALLHAAPHPDDKAIRTALNGNLCRCGTHLRIIRAVKRAAAKQA